MNVPAGSVKGRVGKHVKHRALKRGRLAPVVSSRAGKKNIAAWLPKEFMQSIRLVQAKRADDDPSLQDLMAEAFNELFTKYNVPTVAE
jgi:hypothetical protein